MGDNILGDKSLGGGLAEPNPARNRPETAVLCSELGHEAVHGGGHVVARGAGAVGSEGSI